MNHLDFYWGNFHKVTWIESLRKPEKPSLVEAAPGPADTCTSAVFLDFTNKVSFLPQKQSFRKHYEDSSWDQQCVGKTAQQYFSVINLWSRNPMNEDFIKDHKFFIAHIFFTIFIMLAGTSSQSECVSKVWTTLHQSFTSKDTYVRKGMSSGFCNVLL